MNLSEIYRPITATPFDTENYMEYEPCDVDCYFPKLKREIEPLLFDITDIKILIPIVEKHLLSHCTLKERIIFLTMLLVSS